jgi:hypothetical protein
MKLDPTVKKETLYISVWVLIFSLITQAVFLVAGIWAYTVLLGNILSAVTAICNVLLMGITVQNAVLKDEKEARNLVKTSQRLRTFGLLAVAVIALCLPKVFNIWTVLIPLLFPRIAIAVRPLFIKDK